MTGAHDWRFGEHSVYCIHCGVGRSRERDSELCDASPFKMPAEQMVEELKAAGWKERNSTLWADPDGMLMIGPSGAWRVMTQRKSTCQRKS